MNLIVIDCISERSYIRKKCCFMKNPIMNQFVKPNRHMTTCPICGGALHYEELDQFGMPVGYRMSCSHCGEYSDIWVSGLREVTCGSWNSPDYMSDYAAMSTTEKVQEAIITLELNVALAVARLRHSLKHRNPHFRAGQATA